jgi:hypothetical protein
MLRNVFDLVATENTLRRVLQAVNFARTNTDQLRVVVDSGTVSTLQQMLWGANASQPGYYGTGSPNSMDMRDMYRQAMRTNVIQTRVHRWTFT